MTAQGIDVRREARMAEQEPAGAHEAPPVKKPPWEWYYVPLYFWVGGVAAGSWLAAAAEDVAGRNDRGVVRAGRYLSLLGVLGGTALLILDLGRPERFLNMLRIVRLRSPMSLGSWVLSAFGAFTGAAALLQAAEDGRLGHRPRLARLSTAWAGRAVHLLGLPLALFVGSYTGVLLAATSIPAWASRHRLLGPLFLSSAASSGLAAVSAVLDRTGGASEGARTRLSRAETAMLAGELALAVADRAKAGALPSARGAHSALAAAHWAAIAAGVAAPLALHLARRPPTLVAAGLVLGGGLALRLVVHRSGTRSADTPADTWAFARDGA